MARVSLGKWINSSNCIQASNRFDENLIIFVYIISMILSLQFLKYCKFHRSLKLWRRAIYDMEYLQNSNSRKEMFNSDDSWAMIFPLNPSPSHLKRNCEYFLRTPGILTLVYSLSCQLAKLLIFQIVNGSLLYFFPVVESFFQFL